MKKKELQCMNVGGKTAHEVNIFVKQYFVAFVEDNATMSSIRYFENHLSYFVQNRRKQTQSKRISLRQSVSVALKCIINNNVLK